MQLISVYQKLGIKDLTYRFYEDGRHEMLNEINREEVMADVVQWLSGHC
jgi:alpha-beta hydrolase superfamily lysophospholipase